MQLDIAKHKKDRPCLSHKGFIAWKEIALERFAAQSGYAAEWMRIQDDAVPKRTNKNLRINRGNLSRNMIFIILPNTHDSETEILAGLVQTVEKEA